MDSAFASPPAATAAVLGASSTTVMVVMYHYVRDDESLPRPGSPGPHNGIRGLSTREFTAQIDRLCREMEPTDWPAVFSWLSGRGQLPARSFLLTFDDGLADHAEAAASILESRGLRGVFFVPGAVLAAHRMLSAHALHLLVSTLGDDNLITDLLEWLEQTDPQTDWSAQFQAGTHDAGVARVYDYESPRRARLKFFVNMELPIPLRVAAIESLFERHIGSSSRWARHWYLGWNDLVRMQAAGHTIGGHGFSHEPYGRLTPGEIRQDVSRCSIVLRDGLGPDLRPFSYPFGSTSGPVFDACREAGFVHAFTTQRQWLSRGAHPMQLPRFDTIYVESALSREAVGSSV